MSEHVIKIFGAWCSTETFTINGENASSDDFGDQGDNNPEDAEDYSCGNMAFEPKAPSSEVLEKYKIDELEYWTIANELAEGLSFGGCGWCS